MIVTNFHIKIYTLFLIICLLILINASAQTESEKYFASAFGKYQNKDFYGALIDYNLAIKYNPVNYKLYLCRSIVYIELNEYQKAITDLDTAMIYEINDAEVHFYRAYIYYKENNDSNSLEGFNRAILLNPSYAEAYYYKSMIFLRNNDTIFSQKNLDTAIMLSPDEFIYYFKRAKIHYQTGNFKTALPDYQKCTELRPANAESFYNLGMTYYKLNDNENACQSWYQASKLGNYAAKKAIVNYCR